MAEYLIKQGLVDFIGTDIHRLSHVEKIKHYLLSKNARNDMKALAELIKNDTAFV